MLSLIGAIAEAATFGWDIRRELKTGERDWRWVRNRPRLARCIALFLDLVLLATLLLVAALLILG